MPPSNPRSSTAAAAILLVLAASTAVLRLRAPWTDPRSSSPRDAPPGAASLLEAAGMPPRQLKVRRQRVQRRRRKLADRTKEETLRTLRERMDVWAREGRGREEEVREAARLASEMEEWKELQKTNEDYEPLSVCGRPADVGSTEDFASLQEHSQCPEITKDKPILVLRGGKTHGRTGNNLIEFLHAVQEARDNDVQLGIMAVSWVTYLLTKMWLALEGDDWAEQFESAFCLKIFYTEAELEGWDVIDGEDTKELFKYKSAATLGEYMETQERSIRELFRNYNTGSGTDKKGRKVRDMCSGIDAIFGERGSDAVYSVIHSRSLEGEPGFRLLGGVARRSGCDPVAALEMRPEYVKSILEPLGMMEYPIVLITDHQNVEVIERLRSDPEIGRVLRTVPQDACWIGGDLTLGVMSNVFIGNPASTFTGFIAKARLALGFGNNHLFRARDEGTGEWRTVCGDHCIFDRSIMGAMA